MGRNEWYHFIERIVQLMPKYSIITVCYNDREGLEKTILSTINQTFKNFEYIVVDGGSNDGSKDVIEKYKNHFSWWCSERDGGIYPAMNKGVRHSSGEYCLFMNAGDCFINEHVLEDVVKQGKTTDIVSGYSISNKTNSYTYPHDNNILRLLLHGTLPHQATFIKREVLLQLPYDENFKIVSDCKFWIEAILIHHCSWSFIDTSINIQDMNGVSHVSLDRQRKEWLKMWRECIPAIKQTKYASSLNEIYGVQFNLIIDGILDAVKSGDKIKYSSIREEWKNYSSKVVRRVLGILRWMLYCQCCNWYSLRFWLNLHPNK